jgi:hypothetical protein
MGPIRATPQQHLACLKPFQFRAERPSMTMNDRVDRCRPVPRRYIVPQEGKL